MAYDVVALQTYGLPAELTAQLAELADNFGESFGESFSRISLKGSRFSLKTGSVSELLGADHLDCVILADAPSDHCVYYSGAYDPSIDDVKPTAVWLRDQPAPAVVPPAALERTNNGRLGYSISHRAVIAIVDPATGQLKLEPIVFDIGSMSLYGDDMQLSDGTVAMSYSSFRRWCSKNGIPPCVIPVRVIFDMRQSVPAVRFIPARNGTTPVLFPAADLTNIINLAKSQSVKDLVKVSLIDGTEETDTAPAPVQAPVQQTVAQPAPQPAPIAQPVSTPASQVQPAPAAAPLNLNVQSTANVSDLDGDDQLKAILASAGALS